MSTQKYLHNLSLSYFVNEPKITEKYFKVGLIYRLDIQPANPYRYDIAYKNEDDTIKFSLAHCVFDLCFQLIPNSEHPE
ncbi:MAG: hypothetical protein DRI46_13095 [Chloroflexi bacterium]|nr:MAG: hypothetical protein DRI46_13095 [Chloroflexota bacterium]